MRAQAEAGTAPSVDPGAAVPQMGPGKDAAAVMVERAALYGDAAARRRAQVDHGGLVHGERASTHFEDFRPAGR